MIRILVTGSRTWTARNLLGMELINAVAELGRPDEPVTLVSGACPQGADRIAEEHAEAWGWTVERHDADWSGPCRDTCRSGHRKTRRDGSTYCPAAGNYRNADMVLLGADRCVAFRKDGSRGTTHCGELAEKAGIPTTWIEA